MTTVQITISDALAKEAAAEGLLETGSIEAILRERLAAARVAKMQATRQKLSAAGTPPLTAEEIDAEITAYRAGRRGSVRPVPAPLGAARAISPTSTAEPSGTAKPAT
jgi:hypothetical protein